MKTYIKLLFVTMALLSLTNCDKKDNNTQATYRWDGVNCLNNINGQAVNQSLCQGVGLANTEYYLNASGQCVSRYSGAFAPIQYCQNNGVNNGYVTIGGRCYVQASGQEVALTYCQGTGVGGQCIGIYYVNQFTPVMCAAQNGWQNGQQVYNCSGTTLYNSNFQIVTCP